MVGGVGAGGAASAANADADVWRAAQRSKQARRAVLSDSVVQSVHGPGAGAADDWAHAGAMISVAAHAVSPHMRRIARARAGTSREVDRENMGRRHRRCGWRRSVEAANPSLSRLRRGSGGPIG